MTNIPLDEDEVINEVNVSRRNKRIHTTSKPVCIPLPPPPQPTDSIPHTPERDGDVYSDAEDTALLPATRNHERKGPSRSVSVSIVSTQSDISASLLIPFQTQIEEWMSYRDEVTDELMRHEALPGSPGPILCETCLEPGAAYCCLDCDSESILCQRCIVVEHRKLTELLHRVQVTPLFFFLFLSYLTNVYQKWTGDFFAGATLFDLGAMYQLGHRVGQSCTRPSPAVALTLFDIPGVTTVRICYCYCGEPEQQNVPRVQLLRVQLFPATLKQPGTAFTFRLLNFLHKLQT